MATQGEDATPLEFLKPSHQTLRFNCADCASEDNAGRDARHAAGRRAALLGTAHGRLQLHPRQRHLQVLQSSLGMQCLACESICEEGCFSQKMQGLLIDLSFFCGQIIWLRVALALS